MDGVSVEVGTEVDEQQLLKDIQNVFKDNVDAIRFCIEYEEYIHLIDDLVDKDKEADAKNVLRLTYLAARIYGNPFYNTYRPYLSIVDLLINSTYEDSVIFEHSNTPWKIQAADTLRHCALDMLGALLFLLTTRDTARSIITRMRIRAHQQHKWDFVNLLSRAIEGDK